MSADTVEVRLPEVPAPKFVRGVINSPEQTERYYTAAQLREYATEALMAERRNVAARIADLSAWLRSGNDVPADLPFVFRERWQKIVTDIRALESIITTSETNSD